MYVLTYTDGEDYTYKTAVVAASEDEDLLRAKAESDAFLYLHKDHTYDFGPIVWKDSPLAEPKIICTGLYGGTYVFTIEKLEVLE